jgi:hypothetical protein
MAEPQPAEVHEGAADPHAPTGTAEDRKAAAALSTLDTQDEPGAKKEVDTNALNNAMKNLDVKAKKGEEKKTVKVEAADVKLLVTQLGWNLCRRKPKLTLNRSRSSKFQKTKLPNCYVRTMGMR